VSGDGGLVEHFSGPEDGSGPLFKLSPARRRAWLAAMRPIEPLAWVKRASAPLLFLFGRHDHLVSVRGQTRYWRAAPQARLIRWYDSDHMLLPQAWCDAALTGFRLHTLRLPDR
jgi:pimeloyl-ACP methyl ester carboxylesterase